jgi:hypothetical protein
MTATERDFKPLFTWRSAIAESNLPPVCRHVLLALSLHMNERGGSCWPSTTTIAKETGLNRATVIRQIKVARDNGWLLITQSKGRTSNQYESAVPPEDQPSRKTTVAQGNSRTGQQSQTTTVADDEANRRTHEPQPSHSVHATVAQDDPSTSLSTSVSTSVVLHKPNAVAKAPARPEIVAAFSALCSATGTDETELTPKTSKAIGVALADIRKAWKGDPSDLAAEIVERAGRYLRTMGKATITPHALATHWARLTEQAERLQDPDLREQYKRRTNGSPIDNRLARLRANGPVSA